MLGAGSRVFHLLDKCLSTELQFLLLLSLVLQWWTIEPGALCVPANRSASEFPHWSTLEVFYLEVILKFMCMHVNLHEYLYTMCLPVELKEGIRPGVTGAYELPNLGAGN